LSDDDIGYGSDAIAEAPRARRRRLKARSGERRVQEVDRSASVSHLERAAKRLKHTRAAERVLVVPQWNMDKAVEAMKRAGVSGVVTNLCGTRKQRVESASRKKDGILLL
jgi:hypothetical protein